PSGPLTVTSSSRAGGSKRKTSASTDSPTVEPDAGLENARIDVPACRVSVLSRVEDWAAHPQRSTPPVIRAAIHFPPTDMRWKRLRSIWVLDQSAQNT